MTELKDALLIGRIDPHEMTGPLPEKRFYPTGIILEHVCGGCRLMVSVEFGRESGDYLSHPEVGKPFEYTVQRGDREPVESPHTGRRTGYSAEKCYWTKDAGGNWAAKPEPTFVLLKTKLDPNTTEETYCPDCGKEVVGHNPLPPQELMDAVQADH